MYLSRFSGQVGILAAAVEEAFRHLSPCGIDHSRGDVAEPEEFFGDMSLWHYAGSIGHQSCVETVVETGPLRKRKG